MQALIWIALPGLLYLGLRVAEPRQVACVAMGLAGARLLLARRTAGASQLAALLWPLTLAVAAAVAPSLILNDPRGVLLTPSLVSLALLAVFAWSLLRPPPIVERLARLTLAASAVRATSRGDRAAMHVATADLSGAELRYCRRVTEVWCGFLLANALVCAWLALRASREAWALYAGLLSYIAIGTLFACEYVYRHRRFRRYLGGPFDGVLRRMFPPAADAGHADAGGADRSSVPAPPRLDPIVRAERAIAGGVLVELLVPRDLACWPGHFPSLPIVPGVVQLRWVVDIAARHLGQTGRLARIEGLKMRALIRPGDAVSVRATAGEGGTRVSFAVLRDDATLAEGRLVYVRDEAAERRASSDDRRRTSDATRSDRSRTGEAV